MAPIVPPVTSTQAILHHTNVVPHTAQPQHHQALQGSLSPAGVVLIAMLVSDSGLASSEPQWWTASVPGCVLIGVQPRGGWQVMQRAVQWGEDHLASIFGVTCSKPTLYAYFTCSIRNRLEKWNSPAWSSPMEGQSEGGLWQAVGRANIRRPGKLIDGSRGGQAFICSILRPKDGTAHYNIVEQARMQFRSILLVSAGLMNREGLQDLDRVMREDLQLSDSLGVIFHRLLAFLVVANVLVFGLTISVIYALLKRNIFGDGISYAVQACSLLLWTVGSIGLLMLGGHPRVKIIDTPLPDHIAERLKILEADMSDDGDIHLEFGSIHGSVYTPDSGDCVLPLDVAKKICGWDLELKRPIGWKIGFVWWGTSLLLSIALQIVGSQVTTLGSETFAVVVLLLTSLARGYGVAGPEKWLIPRWKCRANAQYGAILVGKMESRKTG